MPFYTGSGVLIFLFCSHSVANETSKDFEVFDEGELFERRKTQDCSFCSRFQVFGIFFANRRSQIVNRKSNSTSSPPRVDRFNPTLFSVLPVFFRLNLHSSKIGNNSESYINILYLFIIKTIHRLKFHIVLSCRQPLKHELSGERIGYCTYRII